MVIENFIKYLKDTNLSYQNNCNFFLKYSLAFFVFSAYIIIDEKVSINNVEILIVKICAVLFGLSFLLFMSGIFYTNLQFQNLLIKEFIIADEDQLELSEFKVIKSHLNHFKFYMNFGLLIFGVGTLIGAVELMLIAWKI